MLKIALDPVCDDDARRQQIFQGTILFQTGTPASRALCELARGMVRDAFGARDPEHAQEQMAVGDFVELVAPLKSQFTNSDRTKKLIRDYLTEAGADPERTYFDVPRLRIVPHSGYLESGVSYAYKPHRDIWYSSPTAQLNWWLSVFDVTIERTMAFYPAYWDRPLENSSEGFDYDEWTRVGRAQAVSQVGRDTRKHPLPLREVGRDEEFRYALRVGASVLFSAAHLHATAPNTSGATRFSMDFRTVHIDDLQQGRGAPNIDCRARGTTLGDFLRVSDFAPLQA